MQRGVGVGVDVGYVMLTATVSHQIATVAVAVAVTVTVTGVGAAEAVAGTVSSPQTVLSSVDQPVRITSFIHESQTMCYQVYVCCVAL